jgi:histo-blood group ABO system transferase
MCHGGAEMKKLLLLLLAIPTIACAMFQAPYQQPKTKRLKIGLCVMATGRYIAFAKPLFESMQKYFLPEHDVYLFLFTDQPVPDHPRIIRLFQKRLGWPYDTMLRFHSYYKYRAMLDNMDYLYASDVDMLFVNPVGPEILGDLVATISPGFYRTGRKEDYERSPSSLACVAAGEGTHYFAGGFWGGKTSCFIDACLACAVSIATDLSHGVIAKYHDESHWNRYCIQNPPTVILTPEYCSPDCQIWYTVDGTTLISAPCPPDYVEYTSIDGHVRYTKRLVALDKDHKKWQLA